MTKTIIDGRARLSDRQRRIEVLVAALLRPQDRAARFVQALADHRVRRPGREIPEEDIVDVAKRLGLDAAPIIEAYTVTKDA